MNWIALCSESHFAKMRVAFFKDKWLAPSLDKFRITIKHRSCNTGGIDAEFIFALCEDRARHKPYEIRRVGHSGDFIEIIDAPDQSSFCVPPSAKIFHMQVTNRQNSRSIDEIGAGLPPEWTPPVECRTQESEERTLHLAVLKPKIRPHDIDLATEP